MSKMSSKKKCQQLLIGELSEERICNRPAVAVADSGSQHECYVCEECAEHCHPDRLTWLDVAWRGCTIEL